jgi:hypothetical protein
MNMNDSELKSLLLETCPLLPGQEQRAWTALKDRIAPAVPSSRLRTWFAAPIVRPAFYMGLGFLLAVLVFNRPGRHALAFADSQSPGIYATSFYSHSAQAQVVWLNGMEPATDRPTYLDPTTPVHSAKHAATPAARDPDSL